MVEQIEDFALAPILSEFGKSKLTHFRTGLPIGQS